MALRLRSLKTRTALALSSVIVAILVFNAVYLILTKRAELRKGIAKQKDAFTGMLQAKLRDGMGAIIQSAAPPDAAPAPSGPIPVSRPPAKPATVVTNGRGETVTVTLPGAK